VALDQLSEVVDQLVSPNLTVTLFGKDLLVGRDLVDGAHDALSLDMVTKDRSSKLAVGKSAITVKVE
jgi:hypothetical protein